MRHQDAIAEHKKNTRPIVKKETAEQRVIANYTEAMALIEKIKSGLLRRVEQSKTDPKNWGYAGELSHVVDELSNVAIFVNGQD